MNKGKDRRLSNKIALITGGGSGIGRATCLRFAAEGASVIVLDKNLDTAVEASQQIQTNTGESALAIQCDISH
ncbi:MAG: SDR family NAD(P)-dependent oxidoreductase [Candidatus Helarchaeota archaeon]